MKAIQILISLHKFVQKKRIMKHHKSFIFSKLNKNLRKFKTTVKAIIVMRNFLKEHQRRKELGD
jgi:hypothetical protein